MSLYRSLKDHSVLKVGMPILGLMREGPWQYTGPRDKKCSSWTAEYWVDTWPSRHTRLRPADPAWNEQHRPRIRNPQCIPNTYSMHYSVQWNKTIPPSQKKKKLESIPDKEGAHLKAQNRGRRSRTIRAPIHIACRPKFSLAGMPDNGPNAGACGGDIMRVNWVLHLIRRVVSSLVCITMLYIRNSVGEECRLQKG